MSDPLDRVRARIDALDRRLVELLIERADAAREIGRLKGDADRVVFDPGRERAVLEKLLDENQGKFPPDAMIAIFREIISASRALEAPMTVGFLGQAGGFAESAASRRFGSGCRLSPYARGGALFHDLEAGRLDYALVPRDVGDEDAALRSFDLFFEHRVVLFGEFVLKRGYALLAAPGHREPSTVFGHPTALGRCRETLAALPGATVVAVAGSLEAAKRARDETAGAVVPAALAEPLGLEVIRDPAEDDPSPRHRFLILARTAAPRSGHDRTALVCVLANRPRALGSFLEAFTAEGINLAWIEIRESRNRPWEHAFLVEVDGHRDDDPLRRALETAGAAAAQLLVLGSYPVDR